MEEWISGRWNLLQWSGCMPSHVVSMRESVTTRSTAGARGAAWSRGGSSVEASRGSGGLGIMWSSVASDKSTASGGWGAACHARELKRFFRGARLDVDDGDMGQSRANSPQRQSAAELQNAWGR